jgi:EAL domain-containing protein (putative c-di-GMP-specific phosphodiesterase class I)
MLDLASSGLITTPRIAHLAVGHYHHGESVGNLLARIDSALATAEGMGDCAWAESSGCQDGPAASNADWKKLLEGAIESQRLRLIEFPVASTQGALMHLECPLRLQAVENGEWLTAGSFMPMASRLQMTTELDLAAVRLAFDRIATGLPSVAVNLSGESVRDSGFRSRLTALIDCHKTRAEHLWLEVSEVGAFQHFDEFRELCLALQSHGCRIGIEHFGHRFSEIGRLHDLGLDYLKVDGSFIRNIDQQTGNQAFLKGLCNIAHNIDLIVIAENVRTPEELATLPGLGFDGATGPVVSQQQAG